MTVLSCCCVSHVMLDTDGQLMSTDVSQLSLLHMEALSNEPTEGN